jgi:ribosomal protein S18 acetylase RimI-like enzyme
MKNRIKTYDNALIDGFKHRKLFYYAASLLAKAGLQITPYFLTLELDTENNNIKLPSKLENVVCSFITPSEIEKIYNHTETKGYSLTEKSFPDDKILCFALTHEQEIMSFIWCDLTRCRWPISPFPLKQDEAYLFSAYTYKKYRGMNLAPYLRKQLYTALCGTGRTRIYSHTEYFNTPAIHFKKKLNVKNIKLSLYIKLFSKYKWTITLKKYQL